ncbi:MAG: hypothetical protein CBB60_002415 [Armatimonadetes bacterium Cent15-Ar3]|nr:MAG: hypothetical protein CBB60_002415 [Armatimonadetes bacterium Cent15-Ar3]
MSYLENGATHRSMFRLMPPLHHDADPNRSQVLAHIAENMQCDMGRAIRAFNSMRHPKSKVLVFDKVHRMWKGCDWLPAHDDSKDAMILIEHRALERRVAAMDSELRKALKEIKRLNKQMADLYSDAKEMGDTSEKDEDWFKKMREVLETTDEKPSKSRLPKPANTIESMVAQAWS